MEQKFGAAPNRMPGISILGKYIRERIRIWNRSSAQRRTACPASPYWASTSGCISVYGKEVRQAHAYIFNITMSWTLISSLIGYSADLLRLTQVNVPSIKLGAAPSYSLLILKVINNLLVLTNNMSTRHKSAQRRLFRHFVNKVSNIYVNVHYYSCVTWCVTMCKGPRGQVGWVRERQGEVWSVL